MGNYWDAVFTGDADALQRLFAAGQDPNELDSALGMGALHILAMNDQVPAIRATVSAGADVELTDSSDSTPLMWARTASTAQALLEAGADANACASATSTPLIEVIRLGTDGSVGHGGPAAKDTVELLLTSGADARGLDKDGATALHLAAYDSPYESQLAVMSALVNAGSDVNAQDNDGLSPLVYAVLGHSEQAVRWLLEEGADPALESPKTGLRPVDLNDFGNEYYLARVLTEKQQPSAAKGVAASSGGCLLAALSLLASVMALALMAHL